MTKKETIELLTLLASNYKSIDDKLKDVDKAKMLLGTWHECLSDLDFNLCMIAAKKAIMSSSYPPTIHDIRRGASEIVTPADENKSAIEYWNEAYKMIKKGSYMTDEEFEKHSEVVKRFFGCVAQLRELAATDMDTIATVTKGQFLKQVEGLQTRKKEQDLLPSNMKELIAQIGSKNNVKQIEGE
ncbi:replicative helicase loader/inhibitor [Clostridium sp.]|uniref:replicative helicase loader/inhibitor n=1 Tax=Clostridium sp. TaxID=1506 RepID=UPI0032166500